MIFKCSCCTCDFGSLFSKNRCQVNCCSAVEYAPTTHVDFSYVVNPSGIGALLIPIIK